MILAHISIDARNPQHVARILAQIMGGTALPFPPCPGAFIAFGQVDDGTAIEVYPEGMQVQQGPDQIAFVQVRSDTKVCHCVVDNPLFFERRILR